MAKKRKIGLKKAVSDLTAIAEKHLANYPEEERDARVTAFSRAKITSARRDNDSKSSWSDEMAEMGQGPGARPTQSANVASRKFNA